LFKEHDSSAHTRTEREKEREREREREGRLPSVIIHAYVNENRPVSHIRKVPQRFDSKRDVLIQKETF